MLAGELSEAADYVRNLLPAFLESPIRTEWIFIPSAQLGGDSFGYHWIDKENLALYLLDVSGHGIGAALLSVSVMNVLRTQALPGTDFSNPGNVLTGLNAQFQMDYQNNMFFSIWYGTFNLKSRSLSFASAGAPPAVLITPPRKNHTEESHEIFKLGTRDMIIGIREDIDYATRSVTVPEGSRLYLYSDGAYEIRRTNGRMLSLEEFIELLSVQDLQSSSGLEFILNQIQGIAMSSTFDDDVSILEVDFK